MNFGEAMRDSGLGEKYSQSFYKNFGDFTEDNARMILQVHQLEGISCEALAISHMNESSFRFCPPPNDNGHPESVLGFDCGPAQLNYKWLRSIVGAGHMQALPEHDVMGSIFYESDGITPCVFSGSPLANLRQAARWLLAYHKGNEQAQVTNFCGPKSREHREMSYLEYQPLFRKFFQLFTSIDGNN